MSQAATAWQLVAMAVLASGGLSGQTALAPQSPSLNWRRLGPTSFDLHLAGPAGGPISSVWYSADGSTLFVRTADGRSFETADFQSWTRTQAERPQTDVASSLLLSDSDSKVITATGDTRRTWSVGRDLSVSRDGGATWSVVTGGRGAVIGEGQFDVAVNPLNDAMLAVANKSGVWQSVDGGETWSGLNDDLPNLPVARIASVSRGSIRIVLRDGRLLRLGNARSPWEAASGDSILTTENARRLEVTRVLGTEISAWAAGGDLAYAGSADGRIWVSRDKGATWAPPQSVGRGAVQRFSLDPEEPRSALAVLGGAGLHIARTVDAGAVWDDVTGNLADTIVNAVAADRASGLAYAATERGIFMARVDTNSFAAPSAWTLLSGSIPQARAIDVAVEPRAGQLFAALEGYGLYTVPAPVRNGVLRLINSADFSTRAAAPGSLISVLGGKVTSAVAGDVRFPVLASGSTESQLQVPFESRIDTLNLSINTAATVASLPLTIRNVSPAIFVDQDGSPFLVDADSGLTVDGAGSLHPRARLQMMVTGLGRVRPDWPTGVPAPSENPPSVVAGVQGFLDGIPLEVTKATLAPGYVGYYLVETQLPAILNTGSAELYLVVDGQESNRVRIQVDSQ